MRAPKHDIIFDLETVPVAPTQDEIDRREQQIIADIDSWTPPGNVKKAETIEAKRQAFIEEQKNRDVVTEYYEEKSFTPAYLEIVAFTLVICERGSGEIGEVITRTGWDCIHTLPEIFSAHLKTPPRMVGYNIDGFDKPVLLSALLRNKIQLQPKLGMGYDSWLDLRKVLAGFKGKGTLKEYTKLCNLSYQYDDGEDGSMVRRLALAGQWDKLAEYCEGDTINTAEMFLGLTRCLNI